MCKNINLKNFIIFVSIISLFFNLNKLYCYETKFIKTKTLFIKKYGDEFNIKKDEEGFYNLTEDFFFNEYESKFYIPDLENKRILIYDRNGNYFERKTNNNNDFIPYLITGNSKGIIIVSERFSNIHIFDKNYIKLEEISLKKYNDDYKQIDSIEIDIENNIYIVCLGQIDYLIKYNIKRKTIKELIKINHIESNINIVNVLVANNKLYVYISGIDNNFILIFNYEEELEKMIVLPDTGTYSFIDVDSKNNFYFMEYHDSNMIIFNDKGKVINKYNIKPIEFLANLGMMHISCKGNHNKKFYRMSFTKENLIMQTFNLK